MPMPAPPSTAATPWWRARPLLALALLLIAAPFAWPEIPALTDNPGHMGRYRIALDLATSEHLRRFYSFEWMLIPNLGADLLVVPLAPLLGIEGATKAMVMATASLTLLGFLWVAREAHGEIPPTWLFAAPLILGYPFQYGFANFTLAMALAFPALGLWMRLARTGHPRLRAAVFVPVSLVIWLAHAVAWGMFGLLAFAAEFARQSASGRRLPAAAATAALHCLPLAAPLVPTLLWRGSGGPSITGDWFNIAWKIFSLATVLRDEWQLFDRLAVLVLLGVIVLCIASRRLAADRGLVIGAALLFLAFLLLPRIMFSSARTDIRLVPYALAAALLAIRVAPAASPRFTACFALAGLAFFTARIAGHTASQWHHDEIYRTELAALDHLPRGARLASFVGADCAPSWPLSRLDHLPAIATVRREAFSNEQWVVSGAQSVRVLPPYEAYVDPSQFVTETRCRPDWHPLDEALAALPRAHFDHVWLIRPPPHAPALVEGWTPLWRHGTSVLYALPPP
jgi:hypothetical protein